eukprot:5803702-Pleurochrysis_carterae.AAC.2
MLLRRRLERALNKLEQTAKHNVPSSRSADEWAAPSHDANRLAAHRERACLREFLSEHIWRAADLAYVVDELQLTESIFDSKPSQIVYLKRVRELMEKIQSEHFGDGFGLFLHYYEMHQTLDKILRITQAASKHFDRDSDRYVAKVLLYNPHLPRDIVKMPRICPSPSRLAPLTKRMEEQLGVAPGEDGRLAFKSYKVVVQELLSQDVGVGQMPELPFFLGGDHPLPLVISFDATGFGSQQVNTIALNNPYSSKSAQHLLIFGLGNCSDDRSGTTRLLGDNFNLIKISRR